MSSLTRTALDNALRESHTENLGSFLTEQGEQVLRIASGVIAYPVLDAEGNEAWIEVTVKVPKGERLGKGQGYAGYDGYGLAAEYKEAYEAKLAEAEAKRARDEAKRAEAEAKKAKVQVKKENA